jgi:hypothetical protein
MSPVAGLRTPRIIAEGHPRTPGYSNFAAYLAKPANRMHNLCIEFSNGLNTGGAELAGQACTPCADPVPLEEAAEWTIHATQAALSRAGEDDYGILENIAAASPLRMTQTRRACEKVMSIGSRSLPAAAVRKILERLESDDVFEVGALPEAVAPEWAATVREAWQATLQLTEQLFDVGVATGMSETRTEIAEKIAREIMKARALYLCTQWSRDPLPVALIKQCAQQVSAMHPPVIRKAGRRG